VRPIVISDTSEITFQIEGHSDNYLSTLDSRHETITSDHKIKISKAPFSTVLAHPTDTSFMKTIRDKLLWGLDKRN